MDFCLRCNAWHDGLGCPINAEIARLRAELDAAKAEVNDLRQESAARLQRFCVTHWDDKNEGRCPICERDHIASEWSRDRNAFLAEKDDLYSHLAAAQKKRDDARAVAIKSDETAFRFRVKAARLEEQNIILTADLAAASAALYKERDATCSMRIDIADIVRVVAEMPRAKADVEIVRWTERLQAVAIASARRATSPTEPPR